MMTDPIADLLGRIRNAALARHELGAVADHVARGDWARATVLVEEASARQRHPELDELFFALEALGSASDARIAAQNETLGVLDQVAASFEDQAWSWPIALLRSHREEARSLLEQLTR